MSYTSCNDDLIKLVKELNTEDSVWLLHVINKDAIEFESRMDIEDEHDPQLMDKLIQRNKLAIKWLLQAQPTVT